MIGCGEEKRECIKPKAGDADLWIKVWEELHRLAARDVVVEVEHVKAHAHEEKKRKMCRALKRSSLKATKTDELEKEGPMLDEGFMAEARAKTVQQERGEVYAALQFAASFHCFLEEWKDCEELKPEPREKGNFVDKKREETKHRTEWCAGANKCQCMRCGKSSKYMKMPGKCTGPKFMQKKFGYCEKRHLGGHDLVRRVDRQGEILVTRGKEWDRN